MPSDMDHEGLAGGLQFCTDDGILEKCEEHAWVASIQRTLRLHSH